jgi:hypothetical protein
VLELLREVVDEPVVKVLTAQVGVTGGDLTSMVRRDTLIEGSSSEIEDEDVTLAHDLLVETVGDGGSGRLVDDSQDIHAGDGAGVLGGLTLRSLK